jgi:hypothetical protein
MSEFLGKKNDRDGLNFDGALIQKKMERYDRDGLNFDGGLIQKKMERYDRDGLKPSRVLKKAYQFFYFFFFFFFEKPDFRWSCKSCRFYRRMTRQILSADDHSDPIGG